MGPCCDPDVDRAIKGLNEALSDFFDDGDKAINGLAGLPRAFPKARYYGKLAKDALSSTAPQRAVEWAEKAITAELPEDDSIAFMGALVDHGLLEREIQSFQKGIDDILNSTRKDQ